MSFASTSNQQTNRTNRIKAVKVVRNIPTTIVLKKKAKCDAKALEIVQQLMESNVEVEWLLKNLGQINRAHLEDVTEERAIIKLCGYVLCNNPLTKFINKKYYISTLRNKVYDIEKIKNFCSYSCYIAMVYIMTQMFTSPLWLRSEEEIPKFAILPRCQQITKCPPGVEVNIIGTELDENDIDIPVPQKKGKLKTKSDELATNLIQTRQPQSQSEGLCQILFCEKSDNNIINKEDNQPTVMKYNHSLLKKQHGSSENSYEDTLLLKCSTDIFETDAKDTLPQRKNSQKPIDNQLKSRKKSRSIDNFESTEASQKYILETRRKPQTIKSTVPLESLTTRIEISFTEWVTQDTINLLNGHEINKQKIIDDAMCQDKYTVLCRKLNRIHLKKENEELPLRNKTNDLKPVPGFPILEKKAKSLEVKVHGFHEEKIDSIMPKNDNDEPGRIQETEKSVLLDVHNSRALRRRILLSKLNKILPDLLSTLIGPSQIHHVYNAEIRTSIKTLINTFNLSATNILFRTAEWTLIGLIIIKMLGIFNPVIKFLILTKKASMHTSMILMAFKLDSTYLDDLINSRTTSKMIFYDVLEESE